MYKTPIGMGGSGLDDDHDAYDDELQGFSEGGAAFSLKPRDHR
jgi:hypothetical protein